MIHLLMRPKWTRYYSVAARFTLSLQKSNRRKNEELYPLPLTQLDALNDKYNKATWFWVQEEPLNMGAAAYLKMNLHSINYGVISRQPSASTATGYHKVHVQEQEEIIETAFSI